MTDDLVKRLRGRGRDPAWRVGSAIMDAEDTMLKAADRIEALTAERDNYKLCALHSGDVVEAAKAEIERLRAQLAEDADVRTQIDHRLEELVGQVNGLTAERDRLKQEVDQFWRVNDGLQDAMLAAEADNARLLKIIDAIVDEYDGQMHGPILHTINEARAARTEEETK